jgi:hypothetical protein
MDPEAIRRRARLKLFVGVIILLLVIAATVFMLPTYYR